jgi:hypothetical protein
MMEECGKKERRGRRRSWPRREANCWNELGNLQGVEEGILWGKPIRERR